MNRLVGDARCVWSHVTAGRGALSRALQGEVSRSSTSGPLPVRPGSPEPIHCAETVAEHLRPAANQYVVRQRGVYTQIVEKQRCQHERAVNTA